MAGSLEIPTNPVTLAAGPAEEATFASTTFEITQPEERGLVELERIADDLGFIGTKYFVESYRGLSLPASFEASKPVNYLSFPGLTFEGEFMTYSTVIIGRLVGRDSIRALCLAFDNVTLLPYFDSLPDDHLLHVPVLAVDSIEPQAA